MFSIVFPVGASWWSKYKEHTTPCAVLGLASGFSHLAAYYPRVVWCTLGTLHY